METSKSHNTHPRSPWRERKRDINTHKHICFITDIGLYLQILTLTHTFSLSHTRTNTHIHMHTNLHSLLHKYRHFRRQRTNTGQTQSHRLCYYVTSKAIGLLCTARKTCSDEWVVSLADCNQHVSHITDKICL